MNTFLRQRSICLLTALATSLGAVSSPAADLDAVRVLAPISGPYALIGREIVKGVHSIEPDIRVSDTACETTKAAQAASAGLAEGVAVFIGLPCVEALDGAIGSTSSTQASIITIGVAVDGVTVPPKGQPQRVFRYGARASDEIDVLARYLKNNWRGNDFAIIDDGTLYGRQVAEGVRFALEADNLKPVFTDTFRPLLDNQAGLVRRLRKAGATHVLIGGDAYDAAIIAANAASLNYRLQMAGGSSFVAPADDGTLPDGTILASSSLTDWQAMGASVARLALDALKSADTTGGTFATAVAALPAAETPAPSGFRADGELRQNPAVIYEIRQGKPVAVSAPVTRSETGG